MINISPFTDEQWHAMCSADMSMPEPLAKADLCHPFVYHRKYGVFNVPRGMHQAAMCVLWAFDNDFDRYIELSKILHLTDYSKIAEDWLVGTEGTAFRSSCSSRVIAGKKSNLNEPEKRKFGEIEFIF